MKIKNAVIRFALLVAVLVPLRGVHAADDQDESDRSSQVRVDVVVDMTEAGHKVAHPTPDKPAYYLPISVGYKTFGYAQNFQRPPPNEWDIQHALAVALYNQGYRLMTRQGHPALVLVFWWGYMAPQDLDLGNPGSLVERPGSTNAPSNYFWGSGQGLGPGGVVGFEDAFVGGNTFNSFNGDEDNVLPSFSLGFEIANEETMLSMVAGETINDHQKFPDPRLDDVVQMVSEPRYYVLVSAFDFQSWLHHQPVLLWRAHVSTELWGHYFDQVIGTLINTAAPLFGRETKVPHFTSAPTLPIGRVIVGTPEVKDVPIQTK